MQIHPASPHPPPSPPLEWTTPDQLPLLATGDVQVWRVDLAHHASRLSALPASLTEEENRRALRLRRGHTHQHFVVGRTSLRHLLGAALGLPPRDVPIIPGPFGRPQTPPHNGIQLSFNVAHSAGTILIALSRIGAIGIDLEHLDPATDSLEVARHAFTPAEAASLNALTEPDHRRQAFFRCWTRKEAVIKADGRGLSLPMSSFEVPHGPHTTALAAPIYLSHDRPADPSGGSPAAYFLTDLPLGQGFAGAIALDSPNGSLRLLNFNGQSRDR